MNPTMELPAVPFQCLMGLEYSVTAATCIYQPGWKFIIFLWKSNRSVSGNFSVRLWTMLSIILINSGLSLGQKEGHLTTQPTVIARKKWRHDSLKESFSKLACFLSFKRKKLGERAFSLLSAFLVTGLSRYKGSNNKKHQHFSNGAVSFMKRATLWTKQFTSKIKTYVCVF